MKVVIDISENDYWLACNYPDALISAYAHYIKKGIPLPEKHGKLIDADAFAEHLRESAKELGTVAPQMAMALEAAIRDLEDPKKTPTIVEPREWTPIKEGPPKKFGHYLVTITPAAGELWSKVAIAHYSDLMGIAKPGFWTGNVGKNDFEDLTELVTAWAPCPEPYKKEENGK